MRYTKYERKYKYEYKIGFYIASYEMNMRLFKKAFNEEFKSERKRIKWLSYYEQEILADELCDCLINIKNKNNKNSKVEFINSKDRILKLLR